MASGGPVEELCEEASCAVCLDFFTEPVVLAECGHSFCRACLARCWGASREEPSCPQCRRKAHPGNMTPNRQLASVAEIARKLRRQQGRDGEAAEGVCGKHREPLKLFCREDGVLICVVCDRSKEHKHHDTVPADEAAQEYKIQISDCLEKLRKDREQILTYKGEAEKESEDLLKQTESQKQKMVAEFRRLQQFLEDQKDLLLARMKGVQEEIVKKREEHRAKTSEALSSLDGIIRELEEKGQQMGNEFLQDVTNTLQRCKQEEEFENPVAFPPALKWRVWESQAVTPALKNLMATLKDTVLHNQQLQKGTLPLDCQLYKENVTLDPDSDHPCFLISNDQKCLTWRANDRQRFNGRLCVRGKGSLKSQVHYWDVEVGDKEGWAVGICKAYKGILKEELLGPEAGVWAIGKRSGELWTVHCPHNLPLFLIEEPKRIRVLLDLPAKQVSFFDADTAALLHLTAIPAHLEFQPFFGLWKKTYLRICP
ncbi:E3 ubiquitin-protein ligase TRIM7-like [Paroedura picta]|uniref:E3 ubiquitin-protein ligase TRIM7-like n=1 Tax=Paroedura picta TaxID=143630 RepID=UPI004055ED87